MALVYGFMGIAMKPITSAIPASRLFRSCVPAVRRNRAIGPTAITSLKDEIFMPSAERFRRQEAASKRRRAFSYRFPVSAVEDEIGTRARGLSEWNGTIVEMRLLEESRERK